jgi:hypothetical protein
LTEPDRRAGHRGLAQSAVLPHLAELPARSRDWMMLLSVPL